MRPYTYRNEHGTAYYAHKWKSGQRRSGYCMSRAAGGALPALPKGYGIHEDPNGGVTIAKKTSCLIHKPESESFYGHLPYEVCCKWLKL